jgi:hypothetical protein
MPGSNTKNPAFTASSVCGFSRKRATVPSGSTSTTPKRDGGCTVVIIASFPCDS